MLMMASDGCEGAGSEFKPSSPALKSRVHCLLQQAALCVIRNDLC